MLELWHEEIVSEPVTDEDSEWEGHYDREAGRRAFRLAANPILARCEPPREMRENGQVVELSAPGLSELGDRTLSNFAEAPDVESKVEAAVRAFKARDASEEDQLGAIARLAGVLERMREDGRLRAAGLTRKDEGALFEIANNYGVRHDNAAQRRDYSPELREWIFHTYLAAIRLASRATSPSERS